MFNVFDLFSSLILDFPYPVELVGVFAFAFILAIMYKLLTNRRVIKL